MTEEKKIKLSGYKRREYTCAKCEIKTIVETDFLSDSEAKSLHKCKKGKDR